MKSLVPLLVGVAVAYVAAPSSSASASASASASRMKAAGAVVAAGGKDPFVASAPLVVAAECSDGIALMALHTSFAEEPLLIDAEEALLTSDVSTDTNLTTNSIGDIPRSYRGPFRIHSIDRFGTGMICAGWRSHGQMMVDYCRDLAKEELDVYGPPRMTTTHCPEYGRFLAEQLSLWMAYTAILRKHTWSCVGLLATCSSGGEGSSVPRPGCLWLVDKNGAYRVRAHTVGGGPLAGIVNEYLSDMDTDKTAEEILRELLRVVSNETNQTKLPSGTRAELAKITPNTAGKIRLKRLFLSHLLAVKS